MPSPPAWRERVCDGRLVTLRVEYRLGATERDNPDAARRPAGSRARSSTGVLPADELQSCAPYQAHVELPVFGQPRPFPNDWYWLTAYVAMFQPAGRAEVDGELLPAARARRVHAGTEDLRMAIQLGSVADDAFLPLELRSSDRGALWSTRTSSRPAADPLRSAVPDPRRRGLRDDHHAPAWAAIARTVLRPPVVPESAPEQAPSRPAPPPAPRRGTLLALAVLVWLTSGRKRR
jgi:hypothetical protein